MEDLLKEHNAPMTIENCDEDILYSKVLNVKSSTPDIDFKGIVNQICQYTDILDVISKLKKGTEFVVQIPIDFQAGFDAGEYWIMENAKTGKLWPSLMELGEDGKKHIVTPLSIKKQEFIKGNPARDITQNYHNLYMQQQISELINVMENTYKAVERIEHGQMDDRIARLEAGKQGILLALSQKDEASRSQNLSLAINNINIAQNQIAETFKRRVREFESLPKTKAGQFLKEFAKGGYLDNKADEYNEIEEYYSLYLESTKMLAGTYAVTGDIDNAKKVFELAINRINDIDYSTLKTIEYAYPVGETAKIYENAVKYLETEQETCLEDSKTYDCLSITVEKDELLEVIKDVREQEISEEKLDKTNNVRIKKSAKGVKRFTGAVGAVAIVAPVIKKYGKGILEMGKNIIFRG